MVSLFCSITDTIAAFFENTFPEDFGQQIITIFTTTSVDQFNDLFTKLCNNLIALELQASIDFTMVQAPGLKLENNIQTVYNVLKYTRTVYKKFVQQRI